MPLNMTALMSSSWMYYPWTPFTTVDACVYDSAAIMIKSWYILIFKLYSILLALLIINYWRPFNDYN
jgi:hypothetical protein